MLKTPKMGATQMANTKQGMDKSPASRIWNMMIYQYGRYGVLGGVDWDWDWDEGVERTQYGNGSVWFDPTVVRYRYHQGPMNFTVIGPWVPSSLNSIGSGWTMVCSAPKWHHGCWICIVSHRRRPIIGRYGTVWCRCGVWSTVPLQVRYDIYQGIVKDKFYASVHFTIVNPVTVTTRPVTPLPVQVWIPPSQSPPPLQHGPPTSRPTVHFLLEIGTIVVVTVSRTRIL